MFAASAGTAYTLSCYAEEAQNGDVAPDCAIYICGDNACSSPSQLTTSYLYYSYVFTDSSSEDSAVATFSIRCVGSAFVGIDNVTVLADQSSLSSISSSTAGPQTVTATTYIPTTVYSTVTEYANQTQIQTETTSNVDTLTTRDVVSTTVHDTITQYANQTQTATQTETETTQSIGTLTTSEVISTTVISTDYETTTIVQNITASETLTSIGTFSVRLCNLVRPPHWPIKSDCDDRRFPALTWNWLSYWRLCSEHETGSRMPSVTFITSD